MNNLKQAHLKLLTPALIVGSIGAATKWMEAFIVKLTMSPLLFIGCSALLTSLILCIVILNCIKTANQNPIDSLKSQ